jgi:hypothetical protein
MSDNPFDPKYPLGGLLGMFGTEPPRNALADYVSSLTPKPEVSPMARAIADLLRDKPLLPVNPYPYSSGLGDVFGTLAPMPPANPFNALASLIASPPPSFPPPSPPTRSFGSLADLVAPPAPYTPVYTPPKPKPVAPEVKRKAFFSFHYEDDAFRTNNVRNSWKISHPDSANNRSFYDSSLWESRKLTNDEALKRLIRAGVLYTSAVCVLAGTHTWDRRWVRYEIARAIIDGRGLLTVHLNNINHHQTKGRHPLGQNPLAFIGIAKLQSDARLPPRYFLYEKRLVPNGYGQLVEEWQPYGDHAAAVKKPSWLTDPSLDHVMPLSADAAEYDYELENGHRNIGSWIDKAAQRAGR